MFANIGQGSYIDGRECGKSGTWFGVSKISQVFALTALVILKLQRLDISTYPSSFIII